MIEVGKYKIKFVGESADQGYEKTQMVSPAQAAAMMAAATGSHAAAPAQPKAASGGDSALGVKASIKVLSGAAAGREVPLTKVVTTIGKPGVAVAAITKRAHGFVVHHVEGAGNPALNGASIGVEPVPLKNGDLIELAGTQMQFILA
jgi:hypothetical protein